MEVLAIVCAVLSFIILIKLIKIILPLIIEMYEHEE